MIPALYYVIPAPPTLSFPRRPTGPKGGNPEDHEKTGFPPKFAPVGTGMTESVGTAGKTRNRFLSLFFDQIKQVLQEQGSGLLFAYLFGSQARGEANHPDGDVDVAIFVAGDADAQDIRLELYGALSRCLKRNDIDILILNRTRNLMLPGEIIREGIVLLDRNPELREAYEVEALHRAIDFKEQRVALMGR